MRLNEFADPEEYTPPATDAEDFMQQLVHIWPDRRVTDIAPSTLSNRRQPPSQPR
jgi:hypothetical protein